MEGSIRAELRRSEQLERSLKSEYSSWDNVEADDNDFQRMTNIIAELRKLDKIIILLLEKALEMGI